MKAQQIKRNRIKNPIVAQKIEERFGGDGTPPYTVVYSYESSDLVIAAVLQAHKLYFVRLFLLDGVYERDGSYVTKWEIGVDEEYSVEHDLRQASVRCVCGAHWITAQPTSMKCEECERSVITGWRS